MVDESDCWDKDTGLKKKTNQTNKANKKSKQNQIQTNKNMR